MKILNKKNRKNRNQTGFIYSLILLILFLIVPFSLRGSTISGTFTTLATCPVNLSAMAVDPTTGYFYAVADQNQTAACYRYNAATDTWTNMASAPSHKTGNNAGATYLNGNIYVSYTSYADLSVYNISGNSWTTITGPTGGTYTGDISSDGTNVYVACSGTPGKFWRYKVSDGTWTELASVPNNQSWGGLSYNNGYFYSSGGNGGMSFQRYQVSTDVWTSLTDVPGGAVLGAAIYDAYYYCMGSYSGTNLYSYDLGAKEWNNVLTLPWGINDATICVYGNSLYIIQGEAGTGFTKFTPNNPMLTNIETSSLAYSIGDAAAVISSTITASQNSGTNFQSATATISASFETGKDVLSFVNANGITGSWNASTGVLTLTGTTTIANYQIALRSVKYANSDVTSTNATRIISFKVYDGAQYSNTANRNIYFPGVPIITSTTAISSITTTTASSGGFVSEDGGSTVTARGICWSTTSGPLVTGSKTVNGSGLGSFTSSMTGLTSGLTYYVRAYGTNTTGTGYGNELTFTTTAPTVTVSSASLSGFTACFEGAASSPQSFTVSGINLSDDITVTAPALYQVSKLSGSGFGSTVTLTQSGGIVSATTIYARMLTTSEGTITGTISVASAGATTKTVALSGIVSPLAVGGTISGTSPVIYGSSSGTMTLSGYSGTIKRWEKKLGSGSWNTIVNTTTTFSENPASAGTWYYRAVIGSGVCSDVYSSEFTLTASQKELTVTGASVTSKTYNGNGSASITGGTLNGIVGADVVALGNNTTGIFVQTNVGTGISVTTSMTLTGAAAGNYILTQPTLSADIIAKTLTVTGATITNKVYDGNTTATIAGGTLSGIVGADVVSLANNTTGIFASTGVGTAISVTSAMTLSGAAAVNYTLTQPSLSGNITAKTLTVTGAAAGNKVYDGNTTATIAGGTLSGIVGADVVSLANNTTGTFASTGVGIGIIVTSVMTLSGAAGGNYTLTQPSLNANISAKTLTVTGANATNKEYDGNISAIITGGTLSGIVGADVVSLANNTTGIFASMEVGTAISVTSAMILSGAAAVNYTLTQPSLNANITAKTLDITGATATNKVYDGNTTATISGGSLSGIVGSDVVTLGNSTSGIFASANAATGISVITAMTISGAASGNYTLTQPTLTANITTKTLTVIGATASNKVYDGNTTAAITGGTLSGIVGSDDVTLSNSTSGTFATSSVGTVKTVSSAMMLSGSTAGNYTLSQPELNANITAKTLTVTGAVANNKVYDGNTGATITSGILEGIVGSDLVTLANATTGIFATPNPGTGIPVTTAMTLSGADVGNYSLTQPTLSADITNKLLTVTGAIAANKVYDGNITAVITGGTLSGIEGSDIVTLSNNTTGTFATTNAGTSIPLTTSMIIEGADAGLYTLVQPSLTADITLKSLTATADDKSKVTGQSNPVLTISYSGFITGENALVITEPTVSTTAVTSSPAGTYPIALSGGSAVNYSISLVNAVLTVSKAVLTITADNKSKIFGSANPDLTLSYSGFVNGDDASAITQPSVSTTASSGSTSGAYPITLTGGSASNYTLTLVDGTMTIDKAVLMVTADSKSKVYGSANPDLTISYAGFVNGDNVSAFSQLPVLATSANTTSGAGTYSIIPSGGAAVNYSLSYVNGTLTVTKKMLTVTAENKYRVINLSDPAFTITYLGFTLNESPSVITRLPVATTTAVLSSAAGLYPIIPAGGVSSNYDFNYVNGILLVSAIAGDTNGDGIIDGTEIAGDTNGDGKIDGTEIAGDTSGDGQIDGAEFSGDTNGDGMITGVEIAGDNNGDGAISGTEMIGDSNGDGSIGAGEVSGDSNGDGLIGPGEVRVYNPQKDFPNVNHLFTPNNDGINDYWILPDIDKYGISDVKVYSRWGKLVYSNKNYDNQWDGTSNGAKLPDGAYYYIIITAKAGTISGTVNILR